MDQKHKENINKKREAGRQQRRSDLACGRPRRLDPLFYLFKSLGYNYNTDKAIARACALSAQTIAYYRLTDDISLATAQRMLTRMGCSLAFAFEGLQRPVRAPLQPSAKVCLHFPTNPPQEKKSRIRQVAESGRLSFIAQAIIGSGLSLRAFCEINSLNYNQLYYALKIDDIPLSLAIQIGDAIGHPFTFHVFRE